jgi:intracellular multiplication protein IcmT
MAIGPDTHWRDSAHTARFFFVDARAAFPLVFFLLYIHLWSFILAVVTMIFFALIEKYGFSVIVFGRWIRSFIAGPFKSSDPWWKK